LSLYYESHITVEPVFDDRLELFREICKAFGFKVADLLMQKRKVDTPERSVYDTFCTGRHRDYKEIYHRMRGLIATLQRNGYEVWRYKIEDAILDSRYDDVLGVLDDSKACTG